MFQMLHKYILLSGKRKLEKNKNNNNNKRLTLLKFWKVSLVRKGYLYLVC